MYKKEFTLGPIVFNLPIEDSTIDVTELFQNYFTDIKIYLLDNKSLANGGAPKGYYYDHGCFSFPKLYTGSLITGQVINYVSETEFLNQINRAKIKISNLDKCYLYLFLFKSEYYWIQTHASDFKKRIYDHSILMSLDERLIHSVIPLPIFHFSHLIVESDAEISTNKHIVIYIINISNEQKEKISKYQFFFNRQGDLTNVSIKTWK